MYHAINDPRRPEVAPKQEAVPPFINFAPLQNAADALAKSGEHYNQALNAAMKANLDQAKLTALNDRLLTAERLLLNPAWPADASVLQAHALRAGTLHRLCAEDGLRHSREHRVERLQAGGVGGPESCESGER